MAYHVCKITWRPAREDLDVGLFLSLSLLAATAAAAVVFPAKRPFPPFPAICAPTDGVQRDKAISEILFHGISSIQIDYAV